MRYWFHEVSGSIASLHMVWAQAVDEGPDYWPDSLVKRDRASGIEYGSGNYFIAKKKPTLFVSDDGRQPPSLTGDVDGYSSDGRTHIVWWHTHDYQFQGSLENLHAAKARWRCNAWRYEMIGEGKCRQYNFPTFYMEVTTNKDGVSTFKATVEGWFREHDPSWTMVLNLLGPRSDVYKGQFKVWDTNFHFKNDEWCTYNSISEFQVYLNGSAARFESAYIQAWESMPQAACNTMANIMEAISTIQTVIKGLSHPIEAVGDFATDLADPRNAWLAYRYQYQTSRQDVREYISLMKRLRKLRNMSKHTLIRVSGSYGDETGTYECHCKVRVQTILPDNLSELLDMCGLRLNASNLWDMVPYSFVVDWFIKLGDLLQEFEKWIGSMDFTPEEIWYTYRSSYDDQMVYYRVLGRPLGMLPAYTEVQASGRTIRMRIADAISLFT